MAQKSPSLSIVLVTQEWKLATHRITSSLAKSGAYLLCLKA